MESKYYTPDLIEFHFGFEYEIEGFRGHEGFTPQRLDDMGQFSTITSFLDREPNRIRVRHLNQSDIESFGFMGMADEMNCGLPVMWKMSFGKIINEEDCYFINAKLIEGNRPFIEELVIGKYAKGKHVLFDGKVKNKSEFKRLLKQLNIIE